MRPPTARLEPIGVCHEKNCVPPPRFRPHAGCSGRARRPGLAPGPLQGRDGDLQAVDPAGPATGMDGNAWATPMPAAPAPWPKRAWSRRPRSSSRTRSQPTERSASRCSTCPAWCGRASTRRPGGPRSATSRDCPRLTPRVWQTLPRPCRSPCPRRPLPSPTRPAESHGPSKAARRRQRSRHGSRAARPDEVDRLLGGIPLRSPFGPVRLILKSLITPAGCRRQGPGAPGHGPGGVGVRRCTRRRPRRRWQTTRILLDRWGGLQPAQQRFVAETRGLPTGGDGAAEPDRRRRAARPGSPVQRCSPGMARRCRRTDSAPPASTCCLRSRSASPSSSGGSARSPCWSAVASWHWRRRRKATGTACRTTGTPSSRPWRAEHAGGTAGAGGGAASPGRSGREASRHLGRPGGAGQGPGCPLPRTQPRGRSGLPACHAWPCSSATGPMTIRRRGTARRRRRRSGSPATSRCCCMRSIRPWRATPTRRRPASRGRC